MRTTALLLTSLLSASLAWSAAEPGDKELDITLSIVEEGDTAAAVINRLELPSAAALLAPQATVDTTTGVAQPAASTIDRLTEVDRLTDELDTTTGQLLDEATGTVTNLINDTLSNGTLTELPEDIIDQLPEQLPDDLLPLPLPDVIPDDLLDKTPVIPLIDEATPDLDSVIDNLEDSPDVPQVIPETLPETLPDVLPLPVQPLDDLTSRLDR